MRCAGSSNRPTAVKGIDFVKKMKNDEITIFLNFMYISRLLSFLLALFVESLRNQIITKSNILTKRPPVATTVPLWHEHCYWGIAKPDILSDLRSRPEKSNHLFGALLPRWLQAVSNGRPTFNSTEETFKFLRFRQKFAIFDEIYPFGCGVYLSSDICRMRWAD